MKEPEIISAVSGSRTDFQRDFDRIIFSSGISADFKIKHRFFLCPEVFFFVHNRLTHSLEVSSVGRKVWVVWLVNL
ncbi:hypothetical protein [Halpernia sp. GG3]